MMPGRRAFFCALCALSSTTAWGAQQAESYVPSDPASIGRTGRPQLVEFYHPL